MVSASAFTSTVGTYYSHMSVSTALAAYAATAAAGWYPSIWCLISEQTCHVVVLVVILPPASQPPYPDPHFLSRALQCLLQLSLSIVDAVLSAQCPASSALSHPCDTTSRVGRS